MNRLKIFKSELGYFLPIFWKGILNIRFLIYKDYREYILSNDKYGKLSVESFFCRLAGQSMGEIYYTSNPCATEPDHRCKYCRDYIG